MKDKILVLLKKKWIKWPLVTITIIVVFVLCLYGSVYLGVFGKLPNKTTLASLKQAEATQVLDYNEKLIGKYFIYDRQPLIYTDFPKHLIDALIATEDSRFYAHDGVDNISLLRVFFKTILLQDRSSGGGSTITLQLAKNLFGRKDYLVLSTLINKFKESIIAKRMEAMYTKEEILTQYFNTVPFSDNTFGIESASQKFFHKSASALSLSEAATLVGTLKANNAYNPRLYLERSKARRDVVLQQMVKYNYLDSATAKQASAEALKIDYQSFNHDLGIAPYFREQVKKELASILKGYKKENGAPYDVYRDGLIVHTTLDYSMQILAEEAMKEHLTKLQQAFEKSYGNQAPWLTNKTLIDKAIKSLPLYKSLKKEGLTDEQIETRLSEKREMELFEWDKNSIKTVSTIDSLQHYLKFLNAGMIAIEPTTGAVKSYIGGIDYRYFKYDHVSQSERQVGSTFKPFVYTAAIDNGMHPCSYFSPKAVTYKNYNNWTPTNSGKTDKDPFVNYNLERALSESVNTIAVKVLNHVGIPNVLTLAEKLGIEKKLPYQPAIALGVAEISVKELAGAYASYVNHSKGVKPYFITRIEDKNGKEIASFKPEIMPTKAYSDYTRQALLEMMKSTVNKGTASRLRTVYQLKNEIAGKTGTTQDNKDGWFVGITPHLVTINWVGNDNYNIGFKTTGLGQGANSALPIFAKFYQKLLANSDFNTITKSHFEKPSKEVLQDLDCNPEKRDGFLKRVFGTKKKEKKFRSKN